MVRHLNIRVTGKVQGVFFRASTEDKAAELGISGFVRNEPDGTVYIEAEGEEEPMSRFVEWCRQGPRHARVDACIVDPGNVEGYRGFSVRR